MAKSTGLGFTISVDDSGGTVRNISNDITNLTISTPRNPQDVTGVDKSANERLLLLVDMNAGLSGIFNPAAAPSSHNTFRTVPSTSVARTTTLVIAAQTLAGELLYTDYNLNRANDGSFTWSANGVLADGTVPTWA